VLAGVELLALFKSLNQSESLATKQICIVNKSLHNKPCDVIASTTTTSTHIMADTIAGPRQLNREEKRRLARELFPNDRRALEALEDRVVYRAWDTRDGPDKGYHFYMVVYEDVTVRLVFTDDPEAWYKLSSMLEQLIREVYKDYVSIYHWEDQSLQLEGPHPTSEVCMQQQGATQTTSPLQHISAAPSPQPGTSDQNITDNNSLSRASIKWDLVISSDWANSSCDAVDSRLTDVRSSKRCKVMQSPQQPATPGEPAPGGCGATRSQKCTRAVCRPARFSDYDMQMS
jgi:hypothetical protein